MSIEVSTQRVAPLPLAAIRDRATIGELAAKISKHVDVLLASLNKSKTRFGRCVVISCDVFDHPREGQPTRTDVFYLLA